MNVNSGQNYQHQSQSSHYNSNQKQSYYSTTFRTTSLATQRTVNPYYSGYVSPTTKVYTNRQSTTTRTSYNSQFKDGSTTSRPYLSTTRNQQWTTKNTFGSGSNYYNNNSNNNVRTSSSSVAYPESTEVTYKNYNNRYTTTTLEPITQINSFGENSYDHSFSHPSTSDRPVNMVLVFPDDKNKEIELDTHLPAYLNFDVERKD